ncbi:MAG: hypothetical protein DMG89_16030 [Acidobacteria bacterium]|nr:MAG: hypothetical protein DMG89_16030 [Acidobacteriota bacterium]
MSREKRCSWLFCIAFSAAMTASATTLGFQPAATYPVGTVPDGIAAGDFNGDGKLDLAAANGGDGSVSILLGNGDGTFKAAMNFSTCTNCNRIAAADFNADDRSDLVLLRLGDANASDNGDLTIFLSNGDGTFRKGQVLTPGKNPSFVVALDVDADHKSDLIVTNQTDATVAVLFGNGDGSFQPPVPYTTGGGPTSLLLVDFDHDGLQDLAVQRRFGTDILLANGNGTFRSGPSLTTGLFFPIVSWADFNQDGKIDYLTTGCDLTSCKLSVALGNGNGTFQSTRSVSSGHFGGIFIADYDGDGKLDIAGSENTLMQVAVLLGNGDGTFQPLVGFTVASDVNPNFGLAADLNGDKAPDLVSINGDSTIGVLLNNGTDFSISASKPTPGTISGGQSSSSTVTVTLLNSFDNPVALACSVQPAGPGAPLCSLNSDSVTPGPNGSATATLTINTTTAAALGFRPFVWWSAPAIGLIGAGLSRGRSKRKLASSLAVGVLFAGLLLQAACGGNGGPSAQTYTVTITGSSTFTEHSTSVTLGVQ